MKILVTGGNGFLGKNLISELKNRGYEKIYNFNRESTIEDLDKFTKDCDIVYHLAGINRPDKVEEFTEGNVNLSKKIIDSLKKNKNTSPIVISSSVQAEEDNPYGNSKREGENLFLEYSKDNNVDIYLYRLHNLFGKWSRPNYNSVVATFCYNVSRDIDIRIDDRKIELELCYIDDVVEEFINILRGEIKSESQYLYIKKRYRKSLGEISDLIYSFKNSRNNLSIPNMADDFTRKLYSTYLSYMPKDKFSYDLKMNIDERGSFTEFIRTEDRGQVSVNISKPGITKGEHWHHTKNEKFLVVSGKGVIKFRNIYSNEILEYHVSGDKLQVVDIPVGYTHSISNTGEEDMITIMWVNECFDKNNPDTYFMEV